MFCNTLNRGLSILSSVLPMSYHTIGLLCESLSFEKTLCKTSFKCILVSFRYVFSFHKLVQTLKICSSVPQQKSLKIKENTAEL